MFLEGAGVSPKVGQRRRRGEGNSREDRRSRIKNGRVLSLLCGDPEIDSEIDLENESEGDSEGITQMLCSKAVDAEVIPSMDDEGSSGDDGCSSDTDAGSSEERVSVWVGGAAVDGSDGQNRRLSAYGNT